MNLYTNCKSCKKEIKIKSDAATRADLKIEKGDEFNVNCQSCGKIEKKHVNDIKAKLNTTIILIGAGIGILATLILWIDFGAMGTVSVLIPMIFWQQQVGSTKSFNAYFIREKINYTDIFTQQE